MMDIKEKVYTDLLAVLRTLIIMAHSTALAMLEGNKNALEGELYDKYAAMKPYYIVTTGSGEEYKRQRNAYRVEAKQAEADARAWAAKNPIITTGSEEGPFCFVFFDAKHAAPAKYRLYLHIKVDKISELINRLFGAVYADRLRCPGCFVDYGRYTKGTDKIRCKTCGNENFFFKFKFDRYNLRFDRVVMYFSSENTMKAVLEEISSSAIKCLFDPHTPYFTAQIFPGLGFSTSPGEEEKKEYQQATGEEESKISFGQFMTGILAELVVNAVIANKERFKKTYDRYISRYKTGREQMDEANLNKLSNDLLSTIKTTLQTLVYNDPRLKKYFEDIRTKQPTLGAKAA